MSDDIAQDVIPALTELYLARNPRQGKLTGEDFNNRISGLLNDSGAGAFEDQNDRKYAQQSNLRNVIGEIPNSDSPVTDEEFLSSFQASVAPSPAGIQATVESPMVPRSTKVSALANATSNPNWTDEATSILEGLKERKIGAIATVRETAQAEAEAEGKISQLQLTKGDLAAQSIRAKAAQEQAVAADKWGFISRSGVNTSELDSTANNVTAANVALFKELYPLGAEIDAQKQTSFLDNPMEWLTNQFELPGKVARYNSLANQVNRGTEFVKSQDSLVTATNNANAGKLATLSTAEVEAAANEKLISAQIEAQKAAVAAAKLKGSTDAQIRQIEDHYAGQILQLEQRSQTNERLAQDQEDRRSRNADADVARKINQGIALDRQAAAEAKIEEQKDRDARYAAAAATIGMFNIQSEKEYKNLTGTKKKQLDDVIATGGTSLGATPIQAYQNFQLVTAAYNNPNTRDQIKQVYPGDQLKLGLALQDVVNQERSARNSQEKGEQLNTDVNKAVITKFAQVQEDPENSAGFKVNGQYFNPYKAPPIGIVAQGQSLAGNLAATATLETAKSLESTGKSVDTLGMLTTLSSQIGANKNVTAAAEDVVKMYQTIVDATNQSVNFSKFGLPEQSSYNVKVPGVLYGKSTFDMLNPADVSRALLQLYRNHEQFKDSYLNSANAGI